MGRDSEGRDTVDLGGKAKPKRTEGWSNRTKGGGGGVGRSEEIKQKRRKRK